MKQYGIQPLKKVNTRDNPSLSFHSGCLHGCPRCVQLPHDVTRVKGCSKNEAVELIPITQGLIAAMRAQKAWAAQLESFVDRDKAKAMQRNLPTKVFN